MVAVAEPDGGVTTVLPSADGHPRAGTRWLEGATQWCWDQLEGDEVAGGYTVKFAIDFLDAVPDPPRAAAALERLRPALDPDGRIVVPGGTENEMLTPLDFSPRPGLREDGGWTVEYLPWSPAQALEWRGLATISALGVLRANGRL